MDERSRGARPVVAFIAAGDADGARRRLEAIADAAEDLDVVLVGAAPPDADVIVLDGVSLPEQLTDPSVPLVTIRAALPFDGETELEAFTTDRAAAAIIVPHRSGDAEVPLPMGVPATWVGPVVDDATAAAHAASVIAEVVRPIPTEVAVPPDPATDVEEATTQRRRARGDLPLTAAWQARACGEHLRAGRYAEAMDVARALVRAHPQAARGHELLARAALDAGDLDTAVVAAAEAARLQPDEAAHHRRLSIARERAGDLDGAIGALEAALDDERAARRSKTLWARRARERADAAIAADDLDVALAHVDEGLGRADDAKLHQTRGVVLRRLGSVTEAAAAFGRARTHGDDARLWSQQRMLEGRARTLSDGWLPPVDAPGPIRPGEAILHLLERSLPHWRSGYTVRSASILRAERALGLDPVALTRFGFPAFDGAGPAPSVEEVDGIVHHRLLAEDIREPKRLPADVSLARYAAAAADVVARVEPRLLHAASGHENALVGLALRRAFGVPLVYEVRGFREDSWSKDRDRALGSELYDALHRTEAWCMQQADHVVTIAEVMRQDIIARGVDPSRVTVVPNAVDPERFTPRPPDRDLLRSLGLEGKTIVGYISTLVDFEGVDVLLRALARLPDLGTRVGGLIVGGGPELASLRALADELGVAEHVKIIGEVPYERVLEQYAAIDVFVVPRRDLRVCRLVTPLKPFEAMAMERALIVSDIDALREVVGDGARGLTFRAGDDEALAAQIRALVDDPDRRRALGGTSRAWVTAERTWQRNAERYRDIYDRVLRGRAIR